MILVLVVLAIFHPEQVLPYRRSLEPLRAGCSPRSHLLNDCNWCVCDAKGQYHCTVRSCHAVDKFGHFRDAIADISVGMEGRGSWRTKDMPTACTPNAHYARDGLLCVCNEDGDWPSPVCRDVFRVLYSVEPTSPAAVARNRACMPNQLYLVGCNICVCSEGYLDKSSCTNINCKPDDPLVQAEGGIPALQSSKDMYDEIYAACDKNEEYLLGCRKCTCLANNRLLCSNCSESLGDSNRAGSLCDGKQIYEIFPVECNFCQCDDVKNMYCTTKKCLLKETISEIERTSVLGEKKCNGKTHAKKCDHEEHRTIHEECVRNTVYEKACDLCLCYSDSRDRGRELCVRNPICDAKQGLKSEPLKSLRTSYGCEPFRTYERDCNDCQCLADGKTLKCSSKICDAPEASTVKIMPIILKEGGTCPVGSMYYQFCNICVCRENNRSLCTTLSCDSNGH
ncbi:uncharacterized protein LOC121731467 [Aricia agestis]|uniref:uncharacterized protein LOC121731467 n=1 Tax=Aricia agestis TaxID=91739 RepID=UPI001C203C64|nr:uncharacterized protein LOC121731467 [Aricia agestis]